MTVCMLGDGAWGTAVALLLARNGHTVKLWCYNKKAAEQIKKERVNGIYLPNVLLPESIQATTSLDEALDNAQIIFEAIPVQFMREVIAQIPAHDTPWVVLSKGIEKDTLLTPSELVHDVFKKKMPIAACMGPSFAQEVAHKQLTGFVVASDDADYAQRVNAVLKNDYIITHISSDLRGVQLAAACKNVAALGVGILNGAGYGDNTRALFLTRALHEMAELIAHAGGNAKTVYGLSGVGDLVLTCFGKSSKNLRTGMLIGSGKTLMQAQEETGFIPEGANTLRSLSALAHKYNARLPLLNSLKGIVLEDAPVSVLINELKK